MSIRIEPCGPERWALAVSLLPELLEVDRMPAQAWVACLANAPAQLVGAAAVVKRARDQRRTGYRGLVRVLPAWRRQRLGTQLLTRLCEETQRWGVPWLHAWSAYSESDASGELGFLRGQGFERLREISYFYADTAATLPQLRQRVARLLAHQPVAQRWQLHPLTAADTASVVALYAAHFSMSAPAAAARVARALDTPIGRACSVLGRNAAGELCGFLLAKPNDGLPEVDLWMVDPRHRLGPGALLLLACFAERLADIGAPGAHFHCNDETPATLKSARRFGATGTRQAFTYAKWVGVQGGGV